MSAPITTDDVVAVLKPLWSQIPETAERLRGRIEAVLDSAKAKGLIRAELPGRSGGEGRHDDVKFNIQALEKIEHSLRLIGIAPESFEWSPRDPSRPSPYPGLEAFTENDAGVYFGRESRLADALGIVNGLRRREGSRIFTIIAPSGSANLLFSEPDCGRD